MWVTTWTDEADEMLQEGFANGISFSLIAEAITKALRHPCSRNAAIGRAHRLGLKRGRQFDFSPERRRWKQPKYRKPYERKVARVMPWNTEFRKRMALFEKCPPDLLGLPFEKLTDGQCRFPFGEDAAMLFCGRSQMKGSSYCVRCHMICYERGNPSPYRKESSVKWLAKFVSHSTTVAA